MTLDPIRITGPRFTRHPKPQPEVRPCPRCGLKVQGIVSQHTFPTPHDEFIPKPHPCHPRNRPQGAAV